MGKVRRGHAVHAPPCCRIPGSITSTGLYKEIAKIGKTAAQPFKNIQLSLNDTFTSLGSLSMPAAAKPGQLVSSLGGSRPRSSGSGAGRMLSRRSQTGKLHHMYSDSVHGLSESNSSLAALVNSMDALQASVKESTSLLRLDLQQHTALLVGVQGSSSNAAETLPCRRSHHAQSTHRSGVCPESKQAHAPYAHSREARLSTTSSCVMIHNECALRCLSSNQQSYPAFVFCWLLCMQEHLVGSITAQQDSARCTQLLMAINASAALLLLGCSGGWTAAVAAGCMLSVLLYVSSPAVFGSHKQHLAATAGELLRRSSLEAVRGHKRQLSQVSRSAGGVAAGVGSLRRWTNLLTITTLHVSFTSCLMHLMCLPHLFHFHFPYTAVHGC
jgi:hypothetical protein